MAFRVLIAGPQFFRDYARLRSVLDAVLVNRLPDVVIVTAGGPGLPALAASYARSRGLELEVCTLDCYRYPLNPREPRNLELVAKSNAAVIVWDECDYDVKVLLTHIERRRMPVHIIGLPQVQAEPVLQPVRLPKHTINLPD